MAISSLSGCNMNTVNMIEVTKFAEEAMRRRLMEPFLGSEAEELGAASYSPQDDEWWEVLRKHGTWKRWDRPRLWPATTYLLASGDQA